MKKLFKVTVLFLILSLTQCKDDCNLTENCSLEPEPGDCFAVITKYYYDKNEKKCKSFSWGGCRGVVPFDTLDDCENGCKCK